MTYELPIIVSLKVASKKGELPEAMCSARAIETGVGVWFGLGFVESL